MHPDFIQNILDNFHQRTPIRAWSLIVTIYGDAIAPRGGSLWLGSLLDIMEGCNIGGGVVRTAMSRLASDGILERNRIGRNSYYKLSADGSNRFQRATQRIYFAPAQKTPHTWRLAILKESPERGALREKLIEQGYGQLNGNVLVSPDYDTLPEQQTNNQDSAALWFLSAEGPENDIAEFARQAWQIDRIGEGYRNFISLFSPALEKLEHYHSQDGLNELLLRILLIHEYRRVILRDPVLPKEALPDDWPGFEARGIAAAIYRKVRASSEAWLDKNGQNEEGALPKPGADFMKRFEI